MTSTALSPPLALLAVLCLLMVPACHWDDDYYDDDDDCHYHRDDDDCHYDDDDNHLTAPSREPPAEAVLVVKGAAATGLRAVNVTLAEVAFRSSELDHEPVYRSADGYRLDLLALGADPTSPYDLFLARAKVPPATYEAVRLALRDPSIVLMNGDMVGAAEIDLYLDGDIEVDLTQPVPIGPNDEAFLVLDFEVEWSKAMDATIGLRWRVRPIVRVEVRRHLAVPADAAPGVTTTGR